MSPNRRLFRVLPIFFLAIGGAGRAQVISDGNVTVEVNRDGVLVGVPPKGIHTFDGPRIVLQSDPAEWFGVSFDTATEHVVAAGRGLQPDWAGRPPVERVSFVASRSTAVATTRAGDLVVRTEFSFDPIGGYLLVGVTLTNSGSSTLRNVVYSREWMQPPGPGFTFPVDLGLPQAPAEICRTAHMTDDIPPGTSTGWCFSYESENGGNLTTALVPLVLWTGPGFPSGLDFGATNGISFGDYDADGWIDVFALQSGHLWRNEAGTTWHLAADLSALLGPAQYRYGSSFGDYDRDGLPDIVTEPRRSGTGDHCAHLLHNLGGPNFRDVARNPAVIGLQPCNADAETACWGDVDGDGFLDFFLPTYPPWAFGGPGNFFHHNRGPTVAGGACTFQEQSAQAGLDNPPGSARPEGAQFVDIDMDGDIDLYSNGTIYQNRSVPGTADFDPMTPAASGVTLQGVLEEGAVFLDYDLDGDEDLFVVYSSFPGVVIWESRGDGTFFQAENGIVDSPLVGLDLGMSAADWDNDGDIDFTTRQVFRQNLLMETGTRHFVVEGHPTIPGSHITSATPAWGDWDKDGDLDCALGNWLSTGHFYESNVYDASTPPWERRSVRVRPVRDQEGFPDGLDTEYGATVEVRLAERPGGRRRKGFTSSSAGYLNQNEYAVSFALPPHPNPEHPEDDLRFDVAVDFPGPPSGGIVRIDPHVNPRLADLSLAGLVDREIRVFRGGAVVIDGTTYEPSPSAARELKTAAGGLALPGATTPLPPLVAAPSADWYVGLALSTQGASAVQRIEEIVLDGQLAEAVPAAGGAFNLALWDVSDPLHPLLVESGRLTARSSPRNRRHFIPCDWTLAPNRLYRVVAHVSMSRASPLVGPDTTENLRALGGLAFADPNPVSGAAVAGASVDPTTLFLTVRFR
jgi:hypothetical protein